MDVTRIRKKAVQKDKLQEGIRPDRLGPFLFWRCFRVHLPDNLKAKATLRLWQLRDVAIIGVAFLLSVLALAQTGTMLPLVGTVLYAFLAIQVEGSSVLDFLRRAACFLFLQQQYYEWGQEL